MHKNIEIDYGTNDFIIVKNNANKFNSIAVWKPNVFQRLLGITWQNKVDKTVKRLEEQIRIVEESR